MKYPTLEEVNSASKLQLAVWVRHLPSPGTSAIDTCDFDETLEAEYIILEQLLYRFYTELGGWEPDLSKQVSELASIAQR